MLYAVCGKFILMMIIYMYQTVKLIIYYYIVAANNAICLFLDLRNTTRDEMMNITTL